MPFSERTKFIALAIVHIFETSKPLGDYSACVVLNDGAGITYGINQFTHRSKSLYKVVKLFLQALDSAGDFKVLQDALPQLADTSTASLNSLSKNSTVKNALKRAGKLSEMQSAQRTVAFTNYLQPAISACEGSNFVLPMSLAVVYDSINHGSWEKIRDKVTLNRESVNSDDAFERDWIKSYVSQRDQWLESIPRLKPTAYRTDFFLAQIARNNWNLNLPLNVHGYVLKEDLLNDIDAASNPPAEVPEQAEQNNPPASPPQLSRQEIEGEPQSAGNNPEDSSSEQNTDANNNPAPSTDPDTSKPADAVEVSQAVPAKDESDLDKATGWLSQFSAKLLAIPAGIITYFTGVVGWIASARIELVAVLFGSATLITLGYVIAYLILKNRREARDNALKMQREQQAHELTLLQAKSAMQRELQTVKIVPNPIENSDSEK